MCRIGRLGNAVIVSSVVWTMLAVFVALWITAGVAGSLANSTGFSVVAFVVLLLWIVSMLATYVLTGIWLWRARTNADLFAPDRQARPAKAWVWLGWIVPFANFVFPPRVIKDVWRATLRNREALLNWWWASYLVFLVLNIVSTRVGSNKDTFDATDVAGFWIQVVGTCAGLVFWIPLVRTLSKAQDALVSGSTPAS